MRKGRQVIKQCSEPHEVKKGLDTALKEFREHIAASEVGEKQDQRLLAFLEDTEVSIKARDVLRNLVPTAWDDMCGIEAWPAPPCGNHRQTEKY